MVGPSPVEDSNGVETTPGGPSIPPLVFGKQAAKLGDRSDVTLIDLGTDMSESELVSEARSALPLHTHGSPPSSETASVPEAELESSSADNSLFSQWGGRWLGLILIIAERFQDIRLNVVCLCSS
jgi:hypothetical protein